MSIISVKDKVILITGASRGLGKTIALGLKEEGAIVVGTATTTEGAESIQSMGMIGKVCNIRDQKALDPILIELKDKYGNIDCLINNAGVATNTPASGFKEDELQKILETNFTGVFRACQSYYKIQKKGKGNIINLSSVLGFIGSPLASVYSGAKGGIIALSKALAIEWSGNGYRVNVVCPGFFDTDMTSMLKNKPDVMNKFLSYIPMKRMGDPKELIGIILYLASDASTYTTGQTFVVDGGFSAS